MVYITQKIMRKNKETGVMETTMDFTKAEVYGELVECLPYGRVSLNTAPTVYALKAKLKDFCDDDYLIAVGDPSVIAMAGAIVSENNLGRFKMLKWDKEEHDYIKITVDLYNRRSSHNSEEY